MAFSDVVNALLHSQVVDKNLVLAFGPPHCASSKQSMKVSTASSTGSSSGSSLFICLKFLHEVHLNANSFSNQLQPHSGSHSPSRAHSFLLGFHSPLVLLMGHIYCFIRLFITIFFILLSSKKFSVPLVRVLALHPVAWV